MGINVLLYFIVLLLSACDGRQFRRDYSYHPEAEGWFKLHQVPATWRDARLRCHHEGAVLASPEERPLLDAMKTILGAAHMSCGVYTGTSATYAKGYYHSVQGTPLMSFQHLVSWAPNEPDNSGDAEGCLVMLPNGTVADVACSEPLPFLCFRKHSHSLVTNCGTVDLNYSLSLGSCYKFHREPQTWSQAFATCSGEGGHLAVINSDAEAQILKDLFARHPASSIQYINKDWAYVGVNDWGEHGTWRTVHGQRLDDAGFNKWHSDTPNNRTTGGDFCVCVDRTVVNYHDIYCDARIPFFCEKSPHSLVDED